MENLFSPVPEKPVSYSLDHVEPVNHRLDRFNVYWTYAVSDLCAGFVVFVDPPVVSRYIWPPYCYQNTNTGELRFRALLSESGVDRLELARCLP
jgi:hypothetical protein